MGSKKAYLEDEVFIIEDSGEMPEVALHSSLYFLCQDPDGPCFELSAQETLPLKKAVISRFQTIILRDLSHRNKNKSLYRGLERSAVNWQRLKLFAERENLKICHVREKIALALGSFLREEETCVIKKGEKPCINCTEKTLEQFIVDLGLSPQELNCGWQVLCYVKE